MKIDKINANKICSVVSHVNSTCGFYEYRNAKKIFSFTIRKEGYYYLFTLGEPNYKTVDEIEKNKQLVCKDKKVYYKPHLVFKMSNGHVHEKYFETEKELYDFMETEIMKSIWWVNKNK